MLFRSMQQALEGVRAERTTFVIAHRLWTVRQADQILVLRDGRIAERACGSPEQSAHAALLAQEGFYAQLVALQAQGERLMPGDPASAEGGAL